VRFTFLRSRLSVARQFWSKTRLSDGCNLVIKALISVAATIEEAMTIDLIGSLAHDGVRRREPVTVAIPLARGWCTEHDRVTIVDAHQRSQPVQTRVLDRWIDGSARWMLIDFQADISGLESQWRVEISRTREPVSATEKIACRETNDALQIDTGVLKCAVARRGRQIFTSITRDGVALIDPTRPQLQLVDGAGRLFQFDISSAAIEEPGSLRTAIVVDASAVDAVSNHRVLVRLRLQYFAGLATVRAELRVRNPQRATHPNGFWDLGDSGSLLIGDVRFVVAAADRGPVSCKVEPGASAVESRNTLVLHQYSSGGTHWRSPVHMAADGTLPLSIRGYRLHSDDGERAGDRATPVAMHGEGARTVGLAVPQFWQNFPQSIEARDDALTLHLVSPAGTAQELQGGEQKTHTFYVTFGGDEVSPEPMLWCLRPIQMRCSPAVYAAGGAIPVQAARPHPRAADYERLIAPALDGPSSFVAKRETIDEYGWRNFGDLYADHETAYYKGEPPVVSHYNNQYDAAAAFFAHHMRTGDWRWWELGDDLIRHVVDIDIYHTTDDRAAYAGGLFWHTNHYVSAGTATHRAFSRSSQLPGGGPSNEHNYTSGLLLHHYLSGSAASAEAVMELADWVLAMEDGTRSRFRWIDRGPTGSGSATYTPTYHGPGRGAGNSINALLDAHRLTGSTRYLEKAEQLIRRCIHPDDNQDAMGLRDPESRWSYTVFLQVLGKYLDYKSDRDARDQTFDYARASLLAYARWMAETEIPYLTKPERLEFPTETWAAQDLRKAEVFHLAARWSGPQERARFLERRDAFYTTSLDTLAAKPTATFTRPLVLLLVNGARIAFADEPVADAPPPARVFPPRVPFVPQRVRAVRRTVAGLVVATMAAAAVVLAWIW
jgi:PcRGLX-like N-terminal RIFT barrel domain